MENEFISSAAWSIKYHTQTQTPLRNKQNSSQTTNTHTNYI